MIGRVNDVVHLPRQCYGFVSEPIMIGVCDSGFGGLTVLKSSRKKLPERDFVYLGDSGRAPYGARDIDTVLNCAEQCTERLFEEGCHLIVDGCHTVSCTALRHLQRKYAPDPRGPRRIPGVTIPTAEAAVQISKHHIGIIGTSRTVQSGTFVTEIAKLSGHLVTAAAAPPARPHRRGRLGEDRGGEPSRSLLCLSIR